MRGSEKHLLLAVRNQLRTVCGYSDTECAIELDEMAPATVSQLYVAVMPGGCRTGQHHLTSGGICDLVWGIDVLVVKRIRNVPRDRLRDAFVEQLGSLDEDVDKIILAVDWNYDVINAASTSLVAEYPDTKTFIEPLKLLGLEKPRLASPDLFAGAAQNSGSVTSGMVRSIRFGGARRITYTGEP